MQAAGRDRPVFDRGGEGPLGAPDSDPAGYVGGEPDQLPEDLSPELAEADGGRPDLPDETPEGLDDTEEEIRHQAEDRPT